MISIYVVMGAVVIFFAGYFMGYMECDEKHDLEEERNDADSSDFGMGLTMKRDWKEGE